jgi:hypothetical protein
MRSSKTIFPDRAPVLPAADVEGLDPYILRDVDWTHWRPVVVQIEPSDHFIADQSKAIIRFMQTKGYLLVARTAINLILMDRDGLVAEIE